MLSAAVFLLAAVAPPLVSGHFGITYPTWRADTLSDEDNSPYSQWTYPCELPMSSHREAAPSRSTLFGFGSDFR